MDTSRGPDISTMVNKNNNIDNNENKEDEEETV